jgi:hypothetical protein
MKNTNQTLTNNRDLTDGQQDYVNGFRAAADFFELHPELIKGSNYSILVPLNSKEELQAAARVMGGFKKKFDDYYVNLTKKFSKTLSMEAYIPRNQVCERVVVGQKEVPAQAAIPAREAHMEDIVEWRCPEDFSLLKEDK